MPDIINGLISWRNHEYELLSGTHCGERSDCESCRLAREGKLPQEQMRNHENTIAEIEDILGPWNKSYVKPTYLSKEEVDAINKEFGK